MLGKVDNNDQDDDSGYERTPSPNTSTTSATENASIAKQIANTRAFLSFKATDHRRSPDRSSDIENEAELNKISATGRTGREVHAASSSSTSHTMMPISKAKDKQGGAAKVKRDNRALGIGVLEAGLRMDSVVPIKKERKDSAAACERSPSASTSASVEEARTSKAEDIPETSVTPTSDADTRTTEGDPEEPGLFYSRPIHSNRPTSDDQHKSLLMFLSTRKAIEAVEKMEESPALKMALFAEAVPDPYGALRVYRRSQSHTTIRRPPR